MMRRRVISNKKTGPRSIKARVVLEATPARRGVPAADTFTVDELRRIVEAFDGTDREGEQAIADKARAATTRHRGR